MKIKAKLIFLVFFVLLSGYQIPSVEKDQARKLEHNSQNALDWTGAYTGVTPCADCEGIKTLLVLKDDYRFEKHLIYLGKSEEPFVQEGVFNFLEDGNRIALQFSERVVYFHIGEDQIFLLDQEGERIDDRLSPLYRLGRVGLRSGRWMLSRLKGVRVTSESSAPYLEFTDENRLLGFSGCNRVLGEYEITGFNTIHLSNLGLSRRFCPEDQFETPFINTLNLIEGYQAHGRTLQLMDSSGMEVLEFRFRLTP